MEARGSVFATRVVVGAVIGVRGVRGGGIGCAHGVEAEEGLSAGGAQCGVTVRGSLVATRVAVAPPAVLVLGALLRFCSLLVVETEGA